MLIVIDLVGNDNDMVITDNTKTSKDLKQEKKDEALKHISQLKLEIATITPRR